ncbi:MAG: hypothetical protein ACJ72D_21240 [Marmoricola sp.]
MITRTGPNRFLVLLTFTVLAVAALLVVAHRVVPSRDPGADRVHARADDGG